MTIEGKSLGKTPIIKNGQSQIIKSVNDRSKFHLLIQKSVTRGRIPIEKNIIVTDVNGKQIGVTYPKRAKGLVKNGRAEYAGDREIRLKDTRTPTVDIDTEEVNMSKVINFNARDFKFDDDCKTNVGVRGFMTFGGSNNEVWEIGDWGWNWTQITRDITGLEKNTDYVFRFAMTGGHTDDDKEVSLVNIFRLGELVKTDDENDQFISIPQEEIEPLGDYHDPNESAGECNKNNADSNPNTDKTAVTGASEKPLYRYKDQEEQERAWDERYTYCIGKSRFEPVISKRDKTGMLRVFELPFNTGEYENWRIIIVAQYAVARFFTAGANESYSELEDLSFEQWRRERTEQLAYERQMTMDPMGMKGRRAAEAGRIKSNPGNGTDKQQDPDNNRSVIKDLVELAKNGVKVENVIKDLLELAKHGVKLGYITGELVDSVDDDKKEN